MAKPILISGIQPTGKLHLGNYLGALKNFVELQNSGKYQCYFFIADYHSLTIDFDPAKKVVAVDIISKATREIPTVRNWLKIKKSEIFSGETIFLNTIKDIYRLEIIPSITLEK